MSQNENQLEISLTNTFRTILAEEALLLHKAFHRLEEQINKVDNSLHELRTNIDTRFTQVDLRFQDQDKLFREHLRRIDGITEMVAQNCEDIFTIKEDMSAIKRDIFA